MYWLILFFVSICIIVGLPTFIILTIQNKHNNISYDDEDTLQNLTAALYIAICWPIIIASSIACTVILFFMYICSIIFYLIEKIIKKILQINFSSNKK